MKIPMTPEMARGELVNAAEDALYRGKLNRRSFIKIALAAGVAMPAAQVMAQDGEAAAINQQYNSKSLQKSYDFVVVGSGSGGAVVAGRLAMETDAQVLLLEAGGTDQVDNVQVPGMWPTNIRSERDWGHVADAADNVNGRALIMPMGKVVGGGSSVNVQVWARGHKNDYDFWAQQAKDDAWNYDSVLGIFRRIEDWQGAPDDHRRGKGGRLWITTPDNLNPIAPAMLDACESVGIPAFEDQNGAMMEGEGGAAIANVRIKDGRRVSLAKDYIYPAMRRPNMTVLTGAEVLDLTMDGTQVTGVTFVKDGEVHSVGASKQVVLSAGAINTPKILMHSGIGDQAELARHGLETRVNLPGVGQNFQDHVLLAGCIWEYNEPLPPQNNLAEATFFWKSDSSLDTPDLQPFQIEVPYANEITGPEYNPPAGAWTISPGLVRPKSRGRVYLNSGDPADLMRIDAAHLRHPDDLKAIMTGIELCREIGNSEAMKPFVKREVMPGQLDAAGLANFAKNAATTYFHQSGTCAMGTDDMAVVDHKLAVRGVQGLSIADASVMPRVATSNTMAATVVIGERMADILIG
jgi:choline dehydrogenase